MNINEIKKVLNEYFEYIKVIYINEFGKYMTSDTKKRISDMNDVFELEEELKFKIIVDDHIKFNLNLSKYIEEHNIKNENVQDLSDESQEYIKYLIKNENNVMEILKNKLLHQILILFIRPENSVISLGTINIIEDKLASKYKLPQEKFFESKEKEVALYVSQIVGEEYLFSGIINADEKIIEANYNLYIENEEDYENFTKKINKIYNEYHKKVGKVFLTDSLYEYEKLDYNLYEKTKKIQEGKKIVNLSRLKRLLSINESLINIKAYFDVHQILLTALEKKELDSWILEINKIIERIKKDGKDKIADNVSIEYNHILDIENDCMKFVIKIWQNELTNPFHYKLGDSFNFLLSTCEEDIIEATYISSEHLKNIKTLKSSYGYIYEPLDDGLIYSSTDDLLYKKYDSNNYKKNYNTIYVKNGPIEIDNQDSSRLLTPSMILRQNLKSRLIQNKVLLDSSKVHKLAIYCFVEDDLKNSSNYNKALELAEKDDLPIIKIYKEVYFNGVEPSKIQVKIEEEKEEKKVSFFDRLKHSIYEEQVSDFKKTL